MSKKTVLVTGASRGIGKAIAVKFAKKGYRVVINCVNPSHEDMLAQVKRDIESYQVPCLACLGDVGNFQECREIFEKIQKMFGSLDVLVNNAGISYIGLLQDMKPEDWDRIVRTNLTSVFNCCRLAIPDMVKNQCGKIINISSVWGSAGASCEVAYSATKGGINAFTKALAKEVAPSGITVNCVAPGVIATDMTTSLGDDTLNALREDTPLLRLGTPEDIAQSMLFLASPAADFITGQILAPNGGMVI